MDRYARTENALSPQENLALRTKKVCVVGCGGLGGFIIELLARAGVGHITAIDCDTFEMTNLNRQLYCIPGNLGEAKAIAAEARVAIVNPEVKCTPLVVYLDEDNAKNILAGHDLVIDALDRIGTRLMLERECHKLGIPLVHGAIAGWYGQVAVSVPGQPVLAKIYPEDIDTGMEKELGNPPFTPCCIAAWEVAEAIKLLTGKPEALRGQVLYIDLLHNDTEILDLTQAGTE